MSPRLWRRAESRREAASVGGKPLPGLTKSDHDGDGSGKRMERGTLWHLEMLRIGSFARLAAQFEHTLPVVPLIRFLPVPEMWLSGHS